jgi:lipoprotein-anchoring transpeptidase ErfK/SrfK
VRRLLVAAALAGAGCGGEDARRADGEPAGPRTTVTAPERPRPSLPAEGPVRGLGGQVLRRVGLRDAPGGDRLRTLGPRTDMGGPQILAIVARRGRWYGVLHPSLPNGRAGWVSVEAVKLLRERWEIVVDRSERRLHVRRDGKEVEAFPVAVGRPGSPTPTGRFAVTDRLVTKPGSPYGCCILALSGRQTRLPPGWPGGDRLALHGTTTGVVGGAYSSGCVRIREPELRRLMDRIPVGTRVTVRA